MTIGSMELSRCLMRHGLPRTIRGKIVKVFDLALPGLGPLA
jgi:hypothetical protein